MRRVVGARARAEPLPHHLWAIGDTRVSMHSSDQFSSGADMKRGAIVLAAAVVALAGEARADDITDQINEALQAYQKHDLATTSMALDAANSLIRQLRTD